MYGVCVVYHVHCSVYVRGVYTVHSIQSVCSVYGAGVQGVCVRSVCVWCVYAYSAWYAQCVRGMYQALSQPRAEAVQSLLETQSASRPRLCCSQYFQL